jgi:hypothetical protein
MFLQIFSRLHSSGRLTQRFLFIFRLWFINTLFCYQSLLLIGTILHPLLEILARRLIDFSNDLFIGLMIEIILLIDRILFSEPILLFTLILNTAHLWWLILSLRVKHCIFYLDFYVGIVDEFIIFFFLLELTWITEKCLLLFLFLWLFFFCFFIFLSSV